jgi:hypothetical protein
MQTFDLELTFQRFCATLDLDEDWLEAFLPYLDRLVAIGIDLNDLPLQMAIEAYPFRIASACQSVIEYAGFLVHQGRRFESLHHATNCLTKAFVEGWHPRWGWHEYTDLAPQARYLSSYERAYRLICRINSKRGYEAWSVRILDPLSDEAIDVLIPELEQRLTESAP